MSNIVVSEEQILNAEECRVIQRTNLRNQGVVCADDEDMRSLVNKTDDINSWKDYLTLSIKGEIIYDIVNNVSLQNQTLITGMYIVNCPSINVNGLRGCTSLKYAISESVTSIGDSIFSGDSNLKFVVLSSVSNIITYTFNNTNNLEVLILPRTTSSVPNNSQTKAKKLYDVGSATNISYTQPNTIQYMILRKDNGITTLDNASYMNNSAKVFAPVSMISSYQSGTNWSACANLTYIDIVGSRFESLDWWKDVYNLDSTPKAQTTLDGNIIDVGVNETVAIFKHTENISHVYEDGVELQDTDLVKGKTLTSSI